MNINQDGILFRSDRNFMKRDPSSGMTVMKGPNVSQYFGNLYIRELLIHHGLGYIPFFRVYYEPYQDGVLYPVVQDGTYNLKPVINSFTDFTETAPTLSAEADNGDLKLTLHFPFNTLAALDFPVYYIIYKDFGMLP